MHIDISLLHVIQWTQWSAIFRQHIEKGS